MKASIKSSFYLSKSIPIPLHSRKVQSLYVNIHYIINILINALRFWSSSSSFRSVPLGSGGGGGEISY